MATHCPPRSLCQLLRHFASVMVLVFSGFVTFMYINFADYARFGAVLRGAGGADSRSELAGSPAFVVVFHAVLALMIVSYFRTVCSDPGMVPLDWADDHDDEDEDAAEIAPRRAGSGERRRESAPAFCGFCAVPRPKRATHCVMCGRCVLKHDHHCPWVANCVGLLNYKFFWLFIFYAFLACLLIAVAMSAELRVIFGNAVPTPMHANRDGVQVLARAATAARGAHALHSHLRLRTRVVPLMPISAARRR